jgi:hypothetical protein
MSRWIAIIAIVLGLFVVNASAWAALGHDIQLTNPGFTQGDLGWEDHSASVQFGAMFGHDTTAYDPVSAGGTGMTGYMRQIVDTSAGWNPALGDKRGYLSFWYQTQGTSSLKVGIDWWNDDHATKPSGPTSTSMPDYEFELLPTSYHSTDWTQVNLTYDWLGKAGNNNPRYVSLEFYYYDATIGNEAAVDDVSFSAESVPTTPEPSGIIALPGLLGAAGFAWRKRR